MLLRTLLSRDGNPTFNGVDAAQFPGRPELHRLRVGRYRLVYRCHRNVVVLASVVDDRARYRRAED
ncbi:hypothetical protein [Kitasatospora sp. NPDC096204]|uniref:hypothetical protein n=1 Tax=Kitasatospora sp. NPDC096204 TaxID=3364094 RepID=UPI003806E652